jgi:hypothetical protein
LLAAQARLPWTPAQVEALLRGAEAFVADALHREGAKPAKISWEFAEDAPELEGATPQQLSSKWQRMTEKAAGGAAAGAKGMTEEIRERVNAVVNAVLAA